MFKKALLTLTALTAISLLPLPYAAPADAAVKIKPATVKLKPKIRVAKPKVRVKARVKVRAAKVRVKVRTKVRVKAAKVRVKKTKTKTKSAKLHLKPQVHGLANGKKKPIRIRTVRPVLKVNPNLKPLVKERQVKRLCWNHHRQSCRMAPANAVAKRVVPATAKAKLATFSKTKLERRTNSHTTGHRGFRPAGNRAKTNGSGHPSFKNPAPAFLADAARFAELGQAASLAEDLKNLQDTLRVAGHDSGELDMLFTPFSPDSKTPENAGSTPSGLGNPLLVGAGFQVAGIGSGIFGFLPNSHSKDAPSHNLGVNVAAAIGGVASQRGDTVTLPVHNPKNNRHDTVYYADSPGNGAPEFMEVQNHGDNTSTTIHTTHGELDGQLITKTRVTQTDAEGRSTETEMPVQTSEIPDNQQTTELRNPDYAGGGSTCQNISCILHGEKPKGLTKTDMTPGGLPPAPDQAHAQNNNGTAPLYTANDVLERYDPDNQDKGNPSGGKTTASPGGFPEDPNG